jgi:hypothetical protein
MKYLRSHNAPECALKHAALAALIALGGCSAACNTPSASASPEFKQAAAASCLNAQAAGFAPIEYGNKPLPVSAEDEELLRTGHFCASPKGTPYAADGAICDAGDKPISSDEYRKLRWGG